MLVRQTRVRSRLTYIARAGLFACAVPVLVAAAAIADPAWFDAPELAGSFSVYSYGEASYNRAAPFLMLEERRVFSAGATAFAAIRPLAEDSAGIDGSSITNSYNARSCESCHVRDGRGISHAVAFDASGFSVKREPDASSEPPSRHPFGQPPLPAKLTGVVWRAKEDIVLSGGATAHLVEPVVMADGIETELDLRNAPAVYGLGLLEAIPDSDIRSMARAQQYLRYGVRGIVSEATSPAPPGSEQPVGRFGWKGTFPSLADQVKDALRNELGVSPPIGPDLSRDERERFELLANGLTSYLRLLAVPARRLDSSSDNRLGAELFEQSGCAMCHRPSWLTGTSTDLEDKYRNRRIYPFTDMLLHDMGDALKDTNGLPNSRFWRTPPLWGIGAQTTVAKGVGFLHDGRARDLLEAILWHGGEAAYSIGRFKALSPEDRTRLLAFLSSL